MGEETPMLSIIIPALNEADTLPLLLQDLATQEFIQFETIVVDGGSNDNTYSVCDNFHKKDVIQLKVLSIAPGTLPGRARQMNEGARHCNTEDYLFLHADTRINKRQTLRDAQQQLSNIREKLHHNRVAGHFPLRFTPYQSDSRYYFYESKTHLNRPDCINGDQGFWIAHEYFHNLGGFDESLPYMEDARLAQKIFDTGCWITLPGELETSARRFEQEGFSQRQILNSFLCNFNAMGTTQFFESALGAYRLQNKTSKLNLRPFLKLAHQQMNGDGLKTAVKRWYLTGEYIAHNAWQLAFALDCLRNRKQGLPPGSTNARRLEFYDRYIARAMTWPIIKVFTALITIIWFYSLYLTQ